MPRTPRTTKRQRKFAATARVIHMMKPRRVEDFDTVDDELPEFAFASGGPVQ